MLIHYITYTYHPSIHRHFGSFDEKSRNILISHSERETSHSQSESHHIRSGAILTFQASSLEHYSHRDVCSNFFVTYFSTIREMFLLSVWTFIKVCKLIDELCRGTFQSVSGNVSIFFSNVFATFADHIIVKSFWDRIQIRQMLLNFSKHVMAWETSSIGDD